MTSRDFVYWLQGYFELSNAETIDSKKTELIKKHLNMVFHHEIDPSMGDSEHQGKLNALHQGLTDPDIILTEGILNQSHGTTDPMTSQSTAEQLSFPFMTTNNSHDNGALKYRC